MTVPCPCGARHDVDAIVPAYIHPGFGSVPDSIAFHCGSCGSTRQIPFQEAPPHIQRLAAAAEEATRRRAEGAGA